MNLSFGEWVGMKVKVTWVQGDSDFVLRELGVSGAVFEDDDGRAFIPWTAIHSVRLAADYND